MRSAIVMVTFPVLRLTIALHASPGKRPVIQDSIALRFEAINLHDKVGIRCHEPLCSTRDPLPTDSRRPLVDRQ